MPETKLSIKSTASELFHRYIKFVAPLGYVGVSGVYPLVHITNPAERHSLLHLHRERPFAREWVHTLRTLPEGSCIVDIGASFGTYTLLAADILRRGIVIAIEPDPLSQVILARNIALNNVGMRTRILPFAIGSETDTVTLYTCKPGRFTPSLFQEAGLEEEIQVDIWTLDELIKQGIIPIPKALKMDIEGAEGLALEGMRQTLESPNRPQHIFIEVHRGKVTNFGYNVNMILEFIYNHGYEKVFIQRRRDEFLIHFVYNPNI